MKKAAAVKEARRKAGVAAINAVLNVFSGQLLAADYECLSDWAEESINLWDKVDVKATFFHAQKRRRDTDNAMASLKAYYDGFVDADIVPDDSPEHMKRNEPEFKVDKDNPRVEFVLTRMK